MTAASQLSALLAIPPVRPANASAKFLDLINATILPEAPTAPIVAQTIPSRIADALIRAMLGGGTPASPSLPRAATILANSRTSTTSRPVPVENFDAQSAPATSAAVAYAPAKMAEAAVPPVPQSAPVPQPVPIAAAYFPAPVRSQIQSPPSQRASTVPAETAPAFASRVSQASTAIVQPATTEKTKPVSFPTPRTSRTSAAVARPAAALQTQPAESIAPQLSRTSTVTVSFIRTELIQPIALPESEVSQPPRVTPPPATEQSGPAPVAANPAPQIFSAIAQATGRTVLRGSPILADMAAFPATSNPPPKSDARQIPQGSQNLPACTSTPATESPIQAPQTTPTPDQPNTPRKPPAKATRWDPPMAASTLDLTAPVSIHRVEAQPTGTLVPSGPPRPSSNATDAPGQSESVTGAPLATVFNHATQAAEPPLAFAARLTPFDLDVPASALPSASAPGEETRQAWPASSCDHVLPDFVPPPTAPAVPKAQPVAEMARNVAVPEKPRDTDQRENAMPAAPTAPADFARVLTNPSPQANAAPVLAPNQTPAAKPIQADAPPVNVAEALRTSEPAPTAQNPVVSPAQQIAVRIAPAGAVPVDLHVAQRAGEIHVSVRTADTGMQTSLRQDLGTLANSLERAGYRAEMFTSRDTISRPASAAMNFRNDQPQTGGNGRGGSGTFSQGRQQQQPRHQRRTNWLEELETSR